MSLVVSFSIPKDKLDLKKALEKLARLEKCSRSEIIIRAIEEYIARHEEEEVYPTSTGPR